MADKVVINVKRQPQAVHTIPMNAGGPPTQLQFTQTLADPCFLTDPNDLTQATQPVHSVKRSNLTNPYSRSNHSMVAPLPPLNSTAATNVKRDSNYNSNSSNSNIAGKSLPAANLDGNITALAYLLVQVCCLAIPVSL